MKSLPLAMTAAFALGLGGGGTLRAADGAIHRVTGWWSADYRRDGVRLAELDRELAELPALAPSPFASRYGFRSQTLLDPDEPQWLQIDLQRPRPIDRIVAVPAHIPVLGERGEGYGFPRRFKIELSDVPEMTGATTVIDRTTADVVNPGRRPMDFRIEPVTARYIRFTSTRHFPVEDGFIWALEELLVLSGNQSVSIWQPVEASSSLELFPNWSRSRVQDGQSALGLPVTGEASPSRGYLSQLVGFAHEPKWLTVDLGRTHPIEEIRLVPVEPGGFETLGELSFPRAWRVELASDPAFEEIVWNFPMASTNLVGYPGHCAVVIPVPHQRARHLRFVAEELWGTEHQCGYALAEIQAYSGDANVARGRPVLASDAAAEGRDRGWAPSFVTDGFSSRHRLVELPEYLDLIGRRGRLEQERDTLLEQRAAKLRTTGLVLGYGGGTLGGLALCGWGWMLVRQRTLRARAVSRLREQIARDLHDDIGSNLGGIVLLSEVGSRHSDDPQAREDFHAIKEAAEQTSQSMQDIVWLIEDGNTGLRELVTRMRQATEVMLGVRDVALEVDPADFRDRRLTLFFRRHFFFAFKETLHNVRQHAGAKTVTARLSVGRRELAFEVRDDGVGFDPEKPSPGGHGLANLRRRAHRLKGQCHIHSRPGAGTRVTFRAPIHSRE